MRLAYLGLAALIIFLMLMPLETTPRRWAAPDLLVVMTVCWVLRRPEYVPAASVAFVFLLGDFLFLRPPGALTLVMVLATEFLRRRALSMREAPFPTEWLMASGVMLGILLSDRILLSLFLVERPPLGTSLIQVMMNIAIYPVVALGSWFVLGLRKAAPGDIDAMAGTP